MSGKINVLHDEGVIEGRSMQSLLQAKRHLRSKKAQSSMILIIIVLMMFVGIVVFLLSLANTASKDEFTGLYVNNLLLSVMRTDTGYTDSNCKLVSDLVFCAYFTPEWSCGEGSSTCHDLANRTIANYMATFGNQTMSLKYLFTVTPTFVTRDENGEQISLDMGDQSLKKSRTESLKVVSYPLVISKTVGSNQYTLKMQLIVAKK
jgi:hypothetical protein